MTPVKKKMIQNAPRDSGSLSRSIIKTKRVSAKKGVSVRVGPKKGYFEIHGQNLHVPAKYAHLAELGKNKGWRQKVFDSLKRTITNRFSDKMRKELPKDIERARAKGKLS